LSLAALYLGLSGITSAIEIECIRLRTHRKRRIFLIAHLRLMAIDFSASTALNEHGASMGAI
jgi:hypothetical protein